MISKLAAPGGGYDIHYREDLWAGTQDYSVVHETYEIIYETLRWTPKFGQVAKRESRS